MLELGAVVGILICITIFFTEAFKKRLESLPSTNHFVVLLLAITLPWGVALAVQGLQAYFWNRWINERPLFDWFGLQEKYRGWTILRTAKNPHAPGIWYVELYHNSDGSQYMRVTKATHDRLRALFQSSKKPNNVIGDDIA